MNTLDPAPLATLRDIHLPPAVGIWPLAPGWWILAALIVALVVGILLVRHSHSRRVTTWREQALLELDALSNAFSRTRDAPALATALSALLRRIARARDESTEAAALHGQDWLDYWEGDRSSQTADREILRELTRVSFQGVTNEKASPEAWIEFVRRSVERDCAEVGA